MKHKKFVIGGLVVLAVIIIIAGIFFRGSRSGEQKNQEVSMDDPLDIVFDFYNPWLDAVKSTSTDPYTLGYATEPLLSEGLRTRLLSTKGHPETDIDPVLCQTTVPERVTGRIVSKQDDVVRVLIMAKEKELTAQSVFTLKRQNDGWYIDDILCSPGEFELPREFSFDKEGFLLKSVPPPLDPQHWHVVFEENGELGHAAPLFFNAESMCQSSDGGEEICTPDRFMETSKIHVYGQMTELGVEVKRLKFLE